MPDITDNANWTLTAEAWIALQSALDAPPHPLPRMARLLSEPSLFETDAAGSPRPEESNKTK